MARGTKAAVTEPAPTKPMLDDLIELAKKHPLSDHMVQRCNERGIGLFEVYATIAEPESARPGQNGTVTYQRGDIRVVIGDEGTVVTVIDRFEDSRSKPRMPLTPEQVASRKPPSHALDEAWLFAPHYEPESRFMYVTPEIADKLLGINTHNRPFSKTQGDEYKATMAAGAWRGSGAGSRKHATPEPVAIDWNQVVQNGQHRLYGISQSGVGVWLLVCVGMDPANFPVIDTGRKRSYGDALGIEGYEKDRNVLGSITRMVYLFLNKGFTTTHKVSVSTVHEMFMSDPDGFQRAKVVGVRMEKGASCTRTGAAAAYYLIRRVNPADVEAVDEFFFVLSTGVGLDKETDPRKKFRDAMMAALKRAGGRKHRAGFEHLALLIKVWNAWVDGREMKHLMWRKDEQMPAVARLKDHTVGEKED